MRANAVVSDRNPCLYELTRHRPRPRTLPLFNAQRVRVSIARPRPGIPLAMLTAPPRRAHAHPQAAGVDMLGDSLGNVILGHSLRLACHAGGHGTRHGGRRTLNLARVIVADLPLAPTKLHHHPPHEGRCAISSRVKPAHHRRADPAGIPCARTWATPPVREHAGRPHAGTATVPTSCAAPRRPGRPALLPSSSRWCPTISPRSSRRRCPCERRHRCRSNTDGQVLVWSIL